MLGVTPSTLRVWANSGAVSSFRTAGGHRRFAHEDLLLLLAGKPATVADKVARLSDRALARIRQRWGGSPLANSEWLSYLPQDDRDQLRSMGRTLVDLVAAYLSRVKGRTLIAQEAKAIGERYGDIMAAHRFPMSRTLETFIFFRSALVDSALRLQVVQEAGPPRQEELLKLIHVLLDQVLLGTVAGYENAGGGLPPAQSRASGD